MLALLALPRIAAQVLFGLCVWLMMRPGGWAVVCCIALIAYRYFKPL